MRALVGVCVVALACGACESKGDVRRPVLLTTADFEALVQEPAPPETIVDGWGLPGGMRLDRIIAPAAGDASVLVKRDTYTEGYKSAYLTTEVWAGFDEVWVQPVYVAVTAYPTDKPPTRVPSAKTGKWRPIFSVGPGSAFYSPYWRTIYFRIPDGEELDTFNSVRDVLDCGLDFRPAEGRLMTFAPTTVGVPPRLVQAMNGEEMVGGPTPGTGVYDGEDAPFLDFGTDTFTWNANLVVEEAPLFVWVARDANGVLQALDMPTVAGAGPLYSGRKPKVVGGKPKYGSYWRIYTVEMQPGWRVFAPPIFSDLRTRLEATSYLYSDPPYADAIATETDATTLDDWAGRVLQRPSCVADPLAVDPSNFATPDDPKACAYVDSQEKIEALVPGAAIHRTDILVTCPFITYDFQAVVLP